MEQKYNKDYLLQLSTLGVRTEKRIEVMYSDLYRISQNIFHQQCLLQEAYEPEDFFKDKEFTQLRALKKHLEELREWMYPDGLPQWPGTIKSNFTRFSNPYSGLHAETPRQEWYNLPRLIAAFNIRYGRPEEQFHKDREYILGKLEKQHYCLAALEEFRDKNISKIAPIGIDVMQQKIIFPKVGKVYEDGMYNPGVAFEAWSSKYDMKLRELNNNKLTDFHNQLVDRDNKASSKQGMIAFLCKEFRRRKIKINSVSNNNELAMEKCAVLVKDKLHTIEDLTPAIVDKMIRLYQKEKGIQSSRVVSGEIGDGKIYFRDYGYIDSNHLLRFFSNYLVESSKEIK